jgi:5-formyltetrahydrofolate cyclo-ligase
VLRDALSVHFPGADKILKGAVSALICGFWYMAPTCYAGHTRIYNADGFAALSSSFDKDPLMPALQKKHMRCAMQKQRAILFQNHPEAGEKIATLFFEFFNLSPQTIVAGYWPIGHELNSRPLLNMLIQKSFTCALPCLTPAGLLFRVWTPDLSLVQGKFQIFEPPPTASKVMPDLLLIPLLAFDKKGHRLGYGQGHFDRYLHHHKVLTIGIGFKGQEVETIPSQPHDFALDYILTEEGIAVQTIGAPEGI